VIKSATYTAVPNLVQIPPRGVLGKCMKYNKKFLLFIYTLFFRELTYRSDRWADFRAWWLKWCGL